MSLAEQNLIDAAKRATEAFDNDWRNLTQSMIALKEAVKQAEIDRFKGQK